MMTPEQWKQLARFAGVAITGEPSTGMRRNRQGPKGWATELWRPYSNWSDFGPLLLLLWPWLSERIEEGQLNVADNEECLLPLAEDFISAMNAPVSPDKQTKVMQAGCLLGAAIGATMTDERK